MLLQLDLLRDRLAGVALFRALARNQDLAIVKGLLLRFVPCNARDARVCKSSSKASTPSKTAPLCNDIDASRVASASTNAAAPPWPVCAVQPKWSATPLEPAQKGWEPEPQGAPLANLTPRSCGGSSAWPVKPSIGPRPHPSVAT